QHPAGPGRVVIDLPDNAGGVQVGVLRQQDGDHQVDHLPGGEVLTGGFVGSLGKLADEFFEDVPHLRVVHIPRVQVRPGEVLQDLQEQVVGREVHDGVFELVLLEDVPDVGG